MYVKRCLKCWGFNHEAMGCKVPKICAECGGEHSGDCVDISSKCRNCEEAVKKYNVDLDVRHKITDEKCPTYQKIYNNLKRIINYNEHFL